LAFPRLEILKALSNTIQIPIRMISMIGNPVNPKLITGIFI